MQLHYKTEINIRKKHPSIHNRSDRYKSQQYKHGKLSRFLTLTYIKHKLLGRLIWK